MNPNKVIRLALNSEDDILYICHAVRDVMMRLKFRLLEQTKMVTATSELSRNTLIHGGGGTSLIEAWETSTNKKVRVTFEDKGPGIADIEQALQDGYSTGTGLGLGLGGSKRLVHYFSIESQIGQGTKVLIVMENP